MVQEISLPRTVYLIYTLVIAKRACYLCVAITPFAPKFAHEHKVTKIIFILHTLARSYTIVQRKKKNDIPLPSFHRRRSMCRHDKQTLLTRKDCSCVVELSGYEAAPMTHNLFGWRPSPLHPSQKKHDGRQGTHIAGCCWACRFWQVNDDRSSHLPMWWHRQEHHRAV